MTLAEASSELGGRVAAERKLPGLSAWGRVADYRIGQIDKLPNVEVYRGSRAYGRGCSYPGVRHVAVATGATWRRDGVARRVLKPVPIEHVLMFLRRTISWLAGMPRNRSVLVYDDDHYYLGGVIAEHLVARRIRCDACDDRRLWSRPGLS